MARLQYSEMLTSVQEEITGAGGRVTHNDLVARLEAKGQGQIALQLVRMSQAGDIVAQVESVPGSRPGLFYSLAGGE